MNILRINSDDTHFIRKMATKDHYKYGQDDNELTFHLGGFIDGKLATVASFFYEKHPFIEEEHQFRIRGFATLPEFQDKGLSKILLKTALPMIKQNFCSILWCNARENSLDFFEQLEFSKIEKSYNVTDSGPHYTMVKNVH